MKVAIRITDPLHWTLAHLYEYFLTTLYFFPTFWVSEGLADFLESISTLLIHPCFAFFFSCGSTFPLPLRSTFSFRYQLTFSVIGNLANIFFHLFINPLRHCLILSFTCLLGSNWSWYLGIYNFVSGRRIYNFKSRWIIIITCWVDIIVITDFLNSHWLKIAKNVSFDYFSFDNFSKIWFFAP